MKKRLCFPPKFEIVSIMNYDSLNLQWMSLTHTHTYNMNVCLFACLSRSYYSIFIYSKPECLCLCLFTVSEDVFCLISIKHELILTFLLYTCHFVLLLWSDLNRLLVTSVIWPFKH